ncbi:hypothetical protein ADIS_2791 [Lunatimonas lonarensis]|uniref:Uncharacterized protein n=1 Tax=Lunatimonas lonarensis TaxID=1232681 RepID=R7ZRM6_9BACT|nr:hypothetical protein ADIS_2791 [Lunatimonas lonarensis]
MVKSGEIEPTKGGQARRKRQIMRRLCAMRPARGQGFPVCRSIGRHPDIQG